MKPAPSPSPVERRVARPGIERPLVDARVEDVGRGREDRLGPVAVVDVPVEDQDPLGAACSDRVRGRDRDVVEEAEAHRPRRARRGGPAGAGRRARTAASPASSARPPTRRRRRRGARPPTSPREAIVSASIIPPPRAQSASIASTCSGTWTRSSCSRLAAGASTRSSPSQPRARARSRSPAAGRRSRGGRPCRGGTRSRDGRRDPRARRIRYPASDALATRR